VPVLLELRTLSRQYELFHLPVQHAPEPLRDIYYAVSRTCGYDNFIRMPGGARFEVAAAEGVSNESSVTFAKDRILFREESASGDEHLLKRMAEVLTVAADKFALPVYIARTITLRAVCATPRGLSSTAFMAEHLFKLTPQHFAVFDRPALLAGFRVHFPPRDPLREAAHQLRIEPYLRDARSLYVEEIAAYKAPLPARDLARLETEFREAEKFLHDQAGRFLGQFSE
jgi:hypothetical protein